MAFINSFLSVTSFPNDFEEVIFFFAITSSSSKPKKTDSEVSKFISKERIKEMAKEPPIDKISTTRIKNAIANGSYPLDLDKIADALYDAYKELKD